jgi:hypothetical protein
MNIRYVCEVHLASESVRSTAVFINSSQLYKSPRPVAGIVLLFYKYMLFVPYRKHTYDPLRPVTGIVLLLYMYMTFLPHRKHVWDSTACFRASFNFYMYMIFVVA